MTLIVERAKVYQYVLHQRSNKRHHYAQRYGARHVVTVGAFGIGCKISRLNIDQQTYKWGDSDVISLPIYASWFSPTSCG